LTTTEDVNVHCKHTSVAHIKQWNGFRLLWICCSQENLISASLLSQ